MLAFTVPVRADVESNGNPSTADAPRTPLWQRLAQFAPAQRANGTIHVDLSSDVPVKAQNAADEIEQLWNSGAHDAALAALRDLEATGAAVAVGVSWSTPVPPARGGRTAVGGRGTDVRVGAPYVWCDRVSVASGRMPSFKLWATTAWDFPNEYGWSINKSVNDGATWVETYHYFSTDQILDLDTSLREDFLWVAYVRADVAYEPRLSRFDRSTGALDTSYGSGGVNYVYISLPATVKEVAVIAAHEVGEWAEINYEDFYAIQSDGQLRLFRRPWDGDDFVEMSTGVFYADSGLDTGASTHDNSAPWLQSFIGTDNHVYIRREYGSSSAVFDLGSFTGTTPVTSIAAATPLDGSAFCAICAVEHYVFPYGQGIKYWMSHDGGWSWAPSVLVWPQSLGNDYFTPEVACDRNGYAIIYTQETGLLDTVYFQQFLGLGYEYWWSDPVGINEERAVIGLPMAMTTVTTGPDEMYAYGLLYIASDPSEYWTVPFFDRSPGPGGYCHAWGWDANTYISHVNVGSINHASGYDSPGYSDFTEYSTQMQRDTDYALTVATGASSPLDECGVWIDWNEDRDFDDANETVAVDGTPGSGPYTGTITPPAGTPYGSKRMRIAVENDGAPEPCGHRGDPARGAEIEDYTIEVLDYCEATSGCGQYISRVEFAGMDNVTACDGYAYYPDLLDDLTIGQLYPITITITNGYSGTFGGLWFDWNQDADFQDAGEEIALSPSFGPGPYTAIVTPPAAAAQGLIRMRVRLHRETDWPDPCEDEAYGEVEDYVFALAESPYCQVDGACDDLHVSRVQLGTIDNVSACPYGWYGYSDFTDQGTALDKGTETPLTVTVENGEPSDECAVWIDWNSDQDFDDAGEAIPLSGTPGPGPYTALVSPTLDAPAADTRMRVRAVRDHTPLPCGEQSIGETEDYTVTVNNLGYCAGAGGCTEYIGRVQLGEIDNTSGCSLGYANYAHLSTPMVPDALYELTITAGQSYPNDTCSVWVDWSQDGDFDDLDESFPVTGTPGMGPYTALIVPRPGTPTGEARLRIRLALAGPYGPCEVTGEGEVEDYTIVVGTSCPGDFNADNTVDVVDFLLLLGAWGTDGPGADLAEPFDIVDVVDFLVFLSAWGACP